MCGLRCYTRLDEATIFLNPCLLKKVVKDRNHFGYTISRRGVSLWLVKAYKIDDTRDSYGYYLPYFCLATYGEI